MEKDILIARECALKAAVEVLPLLSIRGTEQELGASTIIIASVFEAWILRLRPGPGK